MILAIDIGNTHTVGALFEGDRLKHTWRWTTDAVASQEDAARIVQKGLDDVQSGPDSIQSIGIASVVPSVTNVYEGMSKNVFSVDAVLIDGGSDLGIRILYEDPMAVGADRLCNAVAGYAAYGGPLVIVDFGTATTYDIVAKNGDYMGGVIAPGVETSAADLHRRAARLPQVELTLPPSLIARNTVNSMQAGILYGAIDATEGMVRRLSAALKEAEGKDPVVIGTGGFSRFVADHSDVLDHLEPTLVLDGIRIICERIRSQS